MTTRPAVRRVVWFVVVLAVVAALTFLFSGCNLVGKGRIKGAGVTVQGNKDANGVSLASGKSGEVMTLPAGSKLVIARTEAMEAIPATQTTPAQPAKPATEVVEVVVSKDTVWQKEETRVDANTGVIDQTVALKRIQAGENRYLLFASIGAAVAAGLFVYIKYPTPALLCGGASVVFFLVWKLADLPDWFYVVGIGACIAGVVMWKAHERGEKDERESAANTPVVKTP